MGDEGSMRSLRRYGGGWLGGRCRIWRRGASHEVFFVFVFLLVCVCFWEVRSRCWFWVLTVLEYMRFGIDDWNLLDFASSDGDRWVLLFGSSELCVLGG